MQQIANSLSENTANTRGQQAKLEGAESGYHDPEIDKNRPQARGLQIK
jgi:hypothetical protein